ncbi:MAG TPA: DUF2934 domain-containing protein [Candidatus Binataceae bacterium]|nr:DUF2934 domain-containing protein [Candidatus Binataceae bacterium]
MAKRKSSRTRIKQVAQVENGGATDVTTHRDNANGAEPNIDQIRQRAYDIFLARGCAHGDDWGDWFAAERELNPKHP